jgi:hypothetical protein
MVPFGVRVLLDYLMGVHCHFVLHTRRANLSLLMRQIKGIYLQVFKWQHGLDARLFHGRFKTILLGCEARLPPLYRCLERRQAGAGVAPAPDDWPSSGRAGTRCSAQERKRRARNGVKQEKEEGSGLAFEPLTS